MKLKAQYTHSDGIITASIPDHPDAPTREWRIDDYSKGAMIRKEIADWARGFGAELPPR